MVYIDVSLSTPSSHVVMQEQQASGLVQADRRISEAATSGSQWQVPTVHLQCSTCLMMHCHDLHYEASS